MRLSGRMTSILNTHTQTSVPCVTWRVHLFSVSPSGEIEQESIQEHVEEELEEHAADVQEMEANEEQQEQTSDQVETQCSQSLCF